MTVVANLHDEFKAIFGILDQKAEISLLNALDANYRKSLLLCAASYFEYKVTSEVLEFCREGAGANTLIPSLVQNKAISRQYHSWFEWERPNANSFFSLFGDGFKSFMKTKIREDAELEASVRAFLEIGRERNRLVHQNFGGFSLEKTADEIFELYEGGLRFVESIPLCLRECVRNGCEAEE